MIANTPSAKEKIKALDLALQQIEKQFGKGAIMKLGEERANIAIEVIRTGSIGLDMALGVGGVPALEGPLARFTVDRLSLVESMLSPRGSIYTTRLDAPLGQPPPIAWAG